MLQPISSFFTAKASTPPDAGAVYRGVRLLVERNGSREDGRTALAPIDSTTVRDDQASSRAVCAESCLEALDLWLKWEACQESLTEMMYRQRSQGQRIEALLDECERLRFQASETSKRLLAARRRSG